MNSSAMRDMVGSMLTQLYMGIGIDTPEGNDAIIRFVTEDVGDTAEEMGDGYVRFNEDDVRIGLRRLLEKAATDLD
jgi:hypothetical protein